MIKIGNKIISHKRPPFLIAEISANHKGSFKRALKLVKLAAQSGFDAIKLQTYDPVSIEFISAPCLTFQNLMHLSAVPPPDANRPV